jgi:DNA-binding winged helix-turn-helix (wHTH) protein
MAEEKEYTFGPFRLSPTKEQLWRENTEIRLAPKVFAVLRYLVEHPGELITKNAFFHTIWPDVYVTDAVLSVYIGKAREALGDDSRKPRFIETVRRRGYRFIAACNAGYQRTSDDPAVEGENSTKPIVSEAATTIGSQPLVGREAELSLLKEKFDLAVSGRGSLVFISGPAGIGKTRLAREVRDWAVKSQVQWLEGRYDKASSQPYQAWVEMIRSYLQQSAGRSSEYLDGIYGGQLAKLVPEIQAKSAPSEPTRSDPETERLKLFEGITQFFLGIAQQVPLLLFVDDLQWSASLELLHQLARNIGNQRVLILAAYRDEELQINSTLWGKVLTMNRERLFHALPLEPLGVGAVETLISSRSDAAVAAQLAGLVYRKTAGNPFFVEEVLNLLQQRKVLFISDAGWRVTELDTLETPESVKAVIHERLERLGKDAEALLQTASVIGREFPLRLLRELMAEANEGLIEGLDRCEQAGLIISQQVRGEELYSFTHDMMQEALYDGIGPARRRRHHLGVGQAIEKLYGPRLEEWYDGLAHHFLKGNDLQKALVFFLKAGDKACAICAWGRASTQYQTALALLEELRAEPRQQAEVLEKLALATMWFGKGKDSLENWEKALSLYESLGDTKKAGAVHLQLFHQYYSAVGTHDREKGYRHCAEALRLLEPEGDTVERAQAYTRFGFVSAHRQNMPLSAGIAPLEKGLALARRIEDMPAIAEAEMSLGHVLVYHAGEIKRGLELAQESCETAKRSGDMVLLGESVLRVSDSYLMLLDATRARHWAEKALDISNQSGALRQPIHSSLLLGWISILWGDAPKAVRSLEAARRMAEKAGVDVNQTHRPIRLAVVVVPFFLGEWEQCESEILKWRAEAKASDIVLAFIAWISGWLSLEKGDLAGAIARLREAVTKCEVRGEKPLAVAPLALLSEVASKNGELEEAAAHLRHAREIASPPDDWCGLTAEVLLAEGILSTAQKRWEEAHRAFHQAVETHRRYHLPYYEARALFEWAEMHLSRNRRGDRKCGRELFDQALNIFRTIQAKKMVQKVNALKRKLSI